MSFEKRAIKQFQEELNLSIHDFADCSICGFCCTDEALDIKEPDANRISRNLKIDKVTFYEKYTYYNEETQHISMKMPCPFYRENRCSIYEIRPEMCRNYPVFITENFRVRIVEIEGCALATHFKEAFFEYLKVNNPEDYAKALENDQPSQVADNSIQNADYPLKPVYYFIQWLNSEK